MVSDFGGYVTKIFFDSLHLLLQASQAFQCEINIFGDTHETSRMPERNILHFSRKKTVNISQGFRVYVISIIFISFPLLSVLYISKI